jgi:type II secretory pathway component PulF
MARLLGVLLESKVSLLEALQLTRQAETNHRYAELIGNAELAVSRGEPISAAFADADLINPSIYETIRNGEQSGQVGSLLLHMAGFMDEENEIVVKSLMTLIEPIILLCLGVMVALIALSMFMPLFDLAATAQGGGA